MLWKRRLVVLAPLVLLLLIALAAPPVRAADQTSEKNAAAKKLATVNPTAVAPLSSVLTGTAGAVSFQGGSASMSARQATSRPARKADLAKRQSADPFAQFQPALKQFKSDAVSVGAVVKDRLEKLTGTRLEQVTAWTARMYKQFMSPPVVTPAAGPYVVDRYMHAPLYVTRDGRLKTVVAR